MRPDEEYAVVFSGGGALGAWEVGCLRTIIAHHEGTPPSVVAGASAGGINAAGVCSGMDCDTLSNLWSGLTKHDVFKLRGLRWHLVRALIRSLGGNPLLQIGKELRSVDSVFETTPLADTLTRILRDHEFGFRSSTTAFVVSATQLDTGTPELFYKVQSGTALPKDARAGRFEKAWTEVTSLEMLVQALMGTTALPLLFPPMAGRFDGGVLLNQPISPTILLGAMNLYVLVPSPTSLGRTRHLLEIGSTVMSTWLSASLFAQIQHIKLRNQIRRQVGDPLIRICVVRPQVDLTDAIGTGLLSFGENVPQLIQNGEVAAAQRLKLFDPANELTWY